MDNEVNKLKAQIEELKKALAYVIKEADGWHDESRSGPIDSPEIDAARKLLEK